MTSTELQFVCLNPDMPKVDRRWIGPFHSRAEMLEGIQANANRQYAHIITLDVTRAETRVLPIHDWAMTNGIITNRLKTNTKPEDV